MAKQFQRVDTTTGRTESVPAASSSQAAASSSSANPLVPANLAHYTAPQLLTDDTSIAWDLAGGVNAKITLGGNRTLPKPENLRPGASGFVEITQDSAGNRTLAYHSDYRFPGGAVPVLSTDAGAVDLLAWWSPDGNIIQANLTKGYA